MYKKIVVAIDDSATSRCALQEAVAIAKAQGAGLCLAHVADETLLGMHHRAITTSLDVDQARAAIRDAGRQLLAEAQAGIDGIATETLLVEAESQRVSEAIVDAARTSGADLIVAGTHGRSGIGRLIVGSVAEQLMRLSPVSLLLVRKH